MIVIYGPYPSPELVRDGWMRRIATIERIFADRERTYVFPGNPAWSVDPRDYRVHTNKVAPGATFSWLHMSFSSHHRFLTRLVAQAEFVYAHTSHSAQHLLPYYDTGKIVTDLHGIAPEEELLQGRPSRAAFYGAFEERMVKKSALLVSVTEAMLEHLRRKYPECDTESLVLPIVEDIKEVATSERPLRSRLRVVYAGGLQSWQNVDLMLDAVERCRERCDFEFYTGEAARLQQLARERGLADAVRISTVPPEDLPAKYGEADLGFVLRDDNPVNRVSCPTKLSEYLACGVVPVVSLVDIGDFAALGYRYVSLEELLEGRLPDAEMLAGMRRQNRLVFEEVQQRFAAGEARLRELSVQVGPSEDPSSFLTTTERTAFYPRSPTHLEVEREDGRHAIPFDDVVGAECDVDLELPGSGMLRAVRFYPGDPPFVTTPIDAQVTGADGSVTKIEWTGGCVTDRFGNWLFGGLGASIEAVNLALAGAVRLRLRFEYVLVGPEAYAAGVEPQRRRSVVLRRLARVPGARPVWAALQRLRRRLGSTDG